LSWGAGLRGCKIGDQKVFLKLFRNNSQCLSLVRLGHRHSINQFNRLQLTTISFPVFLSCIAYIHSRYLYSAPSRNLLRRNLRHLNWYCRLGSLTFPQGFFCNKIGAGTHFQASGAENYLHRKSRKKLMTFFWGGAFSLYFRLLPTSYSTSLTIQLSIFCCISY